jgi:hypothetical protein
MRAPQHDELSPEETFLGEELIWSCCWSSWGCWKQRRFLPSRPRVKEYLKAWSHNKRCAQKIDVYLAAFSAEAVDNVGAATHVATPGHVPPASRNP